jgi:hypothetical protein
MDSGKRRSQRDYTLAFKLSVVDQVEKGELGYKRLNDVTASKANPLCWCGYASTGDRTGAKADQFES